MAEHCGNCGAPVELAADGRGASCAYCGATERRAVDPTHLAAALRADLKSTEQLLEHLAKELETAFPEMTEVETSGGLFSAKKVSALVLTLDGAVFRLRRDAGHLHAERVKVVRGIALKTEAVPVDAWVQSLCEALAAMSGSSTVARDALAKMVRGKHGD